LKKFLKDTLIPRFDTLSDKGNSKKVETDNRLSLYTFDDMGTKVQGLTPMTKFGKLKGKVDTL